MNFCTRQQILSRVSHIIEGITLVCQGDIFVNGKGTFDPKFVTSMTFLEKKNSLGCKCNIGINVRGIFGPLPFKKIWAIGRFDKKYIT